MFSTQQIATKLTESFNLLTGGSRTALPRQQTIRASIDWSWNLLSDSERILLRRLSVFAGGWDLEAAEDICSKNGIESHQVLELMTQLVSKSLVVMNQHTEHERRYHLLETIRQYADEKFVEAGEKDAIRTRHLKYYLKLSEEIEPGLSGPQQVEWFANTGEELHNLRAALKWATETDVEAGLYIASRLRRFWEQSNLLEGDHWLAEFLQKPESHGRPRARAKALHAQVQCGLQFDAAHVSAVECLELFRACRDQQGEVDALLLLGWVSSDVLQQVEYNQQALALARSLGDEWSQAEALWQLGWDHRDLKRAFAYWEEAIALFRQVGDWGLLADSLCTLASFLVLDGNVEFAQKYLDESSMLFQRLGTRSGKESLFVAYGQIALMRGDYQRARAILQEWALITEELGNRRGQLWVHVRLGYVALREGDLTEACHILTETAENFQKDGYKIGVVFTLEGIVGLYVAVDKPERAARLIGWADATRKQIGNPRWRVEEADVERDIAAIRARIGDAAYEEAYDEGRAMTLDEAVALALG